MKRMETFHCVMKSVAAGVTAAALDNYLVEKGSGNAYSLARNVSFGIVVGSGIALGDYVAPHITHMTPLADTAIWSGKTLEHRLLEVSFGIVASVGINKFIFRASNGTLVQQAGIVALSGVVGEYVADYLSSRPLSYLN